LTELAKKWFSKIQ